MKLLTLAITLQTFFFNQYSYADELLGPHGGYYRMSGRDHIELVPKLNGEFSVYLLDLRLKNPTIKNSSVNVKIGDDKDKYEKKLATLDCITMKDHFYCTNKTNIETNPNTKLYLKAKRLGIELEEVSYPLPFKSKM